MESEWCRASHRWSQQMCLILGELKEDAIPPKFLVENKIPDCFSLKKVTKRELKATTIWDETHKDQQAGTIRNGTEIEFRFPWGEDGELDLENGEYADEGTRLNMKYKEQARFSLGMALQIDANGNIVKDEKDRPLGKMLPVFEYTSQKIVSNSECMREWRRVIQEPRGYEAKKPWVTTDRVEGAKYKGDPVETLRDIGKTADRQSASSLGCSHPPRL